MKGGLRQSMAWLHTWSGLLVGWLLWLVFMTGTAAYFRAETTLWMQPERHPLQAAGAVDTAAALDVAQRFLQTQAAHSPRWSITLPTPRDASLQLAWTPPAPPAAAPAVTGSTPERPRRQRPMTAQLDPRTGERLPAVRPTLGGDFFYQLHFNLHYVPPIWGRWVVGFAAMWMLVAIVSGVITHRRIFADFFTLRLRKGQRSWLDAHNVSAVLALPYHAMITYTGLVTLMFMYMPWAPQAIYQGDQRSFVAEVFPAARSQPAARAAGAAAPLVPLADLDRQSQALWQGGALATVTVQHPGDAAAQVLLTRASDGLTANPQVLAFDGVQGQLLARYGEDIAPASETRGVLYGLHLGRFAAPLLRWLFFVSGLAGCAMVATGLLLWAAKQRQKHAKALAQGAALPFLPFGPRLVEGLNLGAIAGLPLAMAGFFWGNRLLPLELAGRADAEIHSFFALWALCALLALARPTRRMWQAQLALGALLWLLIPLLNPLTGGLGLAAAMAGGQWQIAGFDLVCLALGTLLLGAAWVLARKPAAAQRATPARAAPSAAAPVWTAAQPAGEAP